jgi:HEAT repeat protein
MPKHYSCRVPHDLCQLIRRDSADVPVDLLPVRINVPALLKLDSQRAIELMLSIPTEDPYSPIHLEAALFLIQQNDSRAIEPLARAITDDRSLAVRNAAIAFLGKLGDPRAVEPLLSALHEKYASMRCAVISSLASLGDARALPPLRALLA